MRQWDGRIGRWMSTDPKHQYASPYLGMGNNPINVVDPDGGEGTDWYKDGEGKIQYNANIANQADMNTLGIDGTYLGITHMEGGMYYPMFGGEPLSMSTLQGQLTQKLDQGLLYNMKEYIEEIDPYGEVLKRYVDYTVKGYENKAGKSYLSKYYDVKVLYHPKNSRNANRAHMDIHSGRKLGNGATAFGGISGPKGYGFWLPNRIGGNPIDLIWNNENSYDSFKAMWRQEAIKHNWLGN